MKEKLNAIANAIKSLAGRGAASQQAAAPSIEKQKESAEAKPDMGRVLSQEKTVAAIKTLKGQGTIEGHHSELPKGASNDNGSGSAHRAVYHDKDLPKGVQPTQPPSQSRGRGRGR